MSFLTGSSNSALRPDDHGAAFYQGLQDFSVALQVTDVVYTDATKYRIPLVTATPTAAWTAEGAEITATDPTTNEVAIVPVKLAALTYISREMLSDSAGQAANVVTKGMLGDLAKKVDQALFGAPGGIAPAGLQSISANVSDVEVENAYANLDPFEAAIQNAANAYRQVNSFVTHPNTALALATLKSATGSQVPLLQPDPTLPTRKTIGGVPLLTSPHVEAGVVWALPKDCVVAVLRTPAELATSEDAAFSSDRVAVRLTQRLAFGFPHAAAISRIALVEGA